METAAFMATYFYREHYTRKMSPALSDEQKRGVVKRISDLTLYEPFQFTGKDYKKRFPELAPLISENVPLSGLYLVAVIEGIMHDLGLMEGK